MWKAKERAHLLFSDLDTEASQQKTTNVTFLMSTQLKSTEDCRLQLYFMLFQCEEEILQLITSAYRMLSSTAYTSPHNFVYKIHQNLALKCNLVINNRPCYKNTHKRILKDDHVKLLQYC